MECSTADSICSRCVAASLAYYSHLKDWRCVQTEISMILIVGYLSYKATQTFDKDDQSHLKARFVVNNDLTISFTMSEANR
jgi:hypothetical protein